MLSKFSFFRKVNLYRHLLKEISNQDLNFVSAGGAEEPPVSNFPVRVDGYLEGNSLTSLEGVMQFTLDAQVTDNFSLYPSVAVTPDGDVRGGGVGFRFRFPM